MKRKIIQIDETLCNGCERCIHACSEGAIRMINGKARLVAEDHCDGLGHCIGHCPTGALKIVEQEDVQPHLESHSSMVPMPCPHAQAKSCHAHPSGLRNWPIQLSLVAANAHFFQHADILIAADCAAFSDPSFHQRLKGKVLLISCPKLDEQASMFEKFSQIFTQNTIRTVSVIRMSVPCCQALTAIVEQALAKARSSIAVTEEVLETPS